MISRSHGNQLVPVSEVGAWTVGVDELFGVVVVEGGALADALVRGLGEAVSVGLTEAPRADAVVVAVAVTVAVAVVVVVTLEEVAGVLGAGFDAVGDEEVDGFDAVGVEELGGFDAVGGGTVGLRERVGVLVSVGGLDLDGVPAVGSVTLGVPSDRVGVGSPEPSPPEPHPERGSERDERRRHDCPSHGSPSAQAQALTRAQDKPVRAAGRPHGRRLSGASIPAGRAAWPDHNGDTAGRLPLGHGPTTAGTAVSGRRAASGQPRTGATPIALSRRRSSASAPGRSSQSPAVASKPIASPSA